jgi:anthranilate/para-aminobenzoate synthase component I
MSPFISLNSWNEPGAILQAAEPEEIVAGGWDDWDKLRDLLARRGKTGGDSVHPQGAAVGYISYEGAFRFAWFPRISVLRENGFSALWNERRASVVARDRRARGEVDDRETVQDAQSQRALRPDVDGYHCTGRRAQTAATTADRRSDGYPWQPNMSREKFESIVSRAQDYITAGDIYQVNLAQKFTTPFSGNPYRLFEHLLARSPAPGGAFLDFGDTRILSASPELFLRIRGRHVTTRPIKGTRPRSRDPVRDEQLAYELLTDPKELAELVMITDLERNDLGRICEYGSVAVTQLVQLERFAQVHHLVSTIEGLLRPEIDSLEAVRACIPGGSISGAPKKRACEIIRELEPCPRGIYTGLIGYFDASGDAAFSIAIRTMIQEGETLYFSTGSGITSGSVPALEYEETLHKAAGMRLALEAYATSVQRSPERAT